MKPLVYDWQTWGPRNSRSNWNLKMLVFEEKENPEYPEKSFREQSSGTNNKLSPFDTGTTNFTSLNNSLLKTNLVFCLIDENFFCQKSSTQAIVLYNFLARTFDTIHKWSMNSALRPRNTEHVPCGKLSMTAGQFTLQKTGNESATWGIVGLFGRTRFLQPVLLSEFTIIVNSGKSAFLL